MGMQKSTVLLAVLVTSLLFTPAIAAAQTFSGGQAFDFIWVKTFGFQPQWAKQPNLLIVNVLLPCVAVYAIFLGFMRTMRIFAGMGSMEHVLAIVVTLSMLFLKVIAWVAGAMAGLGIFSVAIFLGVMVIGGVLYGIGFYRQRRGEIDSLVGDAQRVEGKIDKDINKTGKKRWKLLRELEKAEWAGDMRKRALIMKQLELLKSEEVDLKSRRRRVEESIFEMPAGAGDTPTLPKKRKTAI
jgi:hypothetical protein